MSVLKQLSYSSFLEPDIVVSTDPRDYEVLIGNRAWITKNNLEITDEMDAALIAQERQGQTAVLVAIGGIFYVEFNIN